MLLSTKEVADALGVSERHVKNLMYSGALRSITLGRLRRIYIGDLHAYIDERREVARPRRPF
jgi:excisionase family DNA binding protein